MRSNPRARVVALATSTAGLLALAACGPDARIKQLTEGISRDSVLKVIGQDAPAGDPLPNVHSTEEFLHAGQMIEVLYFHPDGEKGSAADTTTRFDELTPVVLVDQTFRGAGWDVWDSVSTAHAIPLKKRED